MMDCRKLRNGDAGHIRVIDLAVSGEGVEERDSGQLETVSGGALDFGLPLFVYPGVENVPIILGDLRGASFAGWCLGKRGAAGRFWRGNGGGAGGEVVHPIEDFLQGDTELLNLRSGLRELDLGLLEGLSQLFDLAGEFRADVWRRRCRGGLRTRNGAGQE